MILVLSSWRGTGSVFLQPGLKYDEGRGFFCFYSFFYLLFHLLFCFSSSRGQRHCGSTHWWSCWWWVFRDIAFYSPLSWCFISSAQLLIPLCLTELLFFIYFLFFQMHMEEPCFDFLRTKETLGWVLVVSINTFHFGFETSHVWENVISPEHFYFVICLFVGFIYNLLFLWAFQFNVILIEADYEPIRKCSELRLGLRHVTDSAPDIFINGQFSFVFTVGPKIFTT